MPRQDASFSIPHLPLGRYRAQLLANRYMHASSLTFDIDRAGVKRVEATVPTFGAIEGSVAWSQNPTDASVTITITRGEEWIDELAMRMQGSFTVPRLEPGTYHLTAEARGSDGKTWADSVSVRVERQQAVPATLHLTPR
jgi:hypothetical protein